MGAAYDIADYLEYFAQNPEYALNQNLGQAYQGAKNWLSGQIDYGRQVIQSGDSRLLLVMAFNVATGVVTAGMIALLAPVIGPAALLIIPAMAIINTAVNNYAYGQPHVNLARLIAKSYRQSAQEKWENSYGNTN
jgi:hypothetical protein